MIQQSLRKIKKIKKLSGGDSAPEVDNQRRLLIKKKKNCKQTTKKTTHSKTNTRMLKFRYGLTYSQRSILHQ